MILGAVLAGGQSRRFGSDKAEAVWNGTALIDHAVANLAGVVATIVVCGRERHDLVSIPDRPHAGLGPLGGLNAALHHAVSLGYPRVITVPCDTPLLDPSLLAALASLHGDAVLAGMPVIGSWRGHHADALEHYLHTGQSRSVRAWASHVGACELDLPSPANINRPADLAMLGRD